jgi:hypothetical protein
MPDGQLKGGKTMEKPDENTVPMGPPKWRFMGVDHE